MVKSEVRLINVNDFKVYYSKVNSDPFEYTLDVSDEYIVGFIDGAEDVLYELDKADTVDYGKLILEIYNMGKAYDAIEDLVKLLREEKYERLSMPPSNESTISKDYLENE